MALPFTPTDFRITRALLLIVAVGIPLLGIGAPGAAWVAGEPLDWEGQVTGSTAVPASLAEPAPGVELVWDGTAQFSLVDVSSMDRLIALLPAAAVSLLVAAIALILAGLLDRIQSGQPFVPASVRSIRRIAVLVAVGSVVVPLLTTLADQRLVPRAVGPDASLHWSYTVSVAWLALALLLLALAEAFRVGQRLAHDVEGLV